MPAAFARRSDEVPLAIWAVSGLNARVTTAPAGSTSSNQSVSLTRYDGAGCRGSAQVALPMASNQASPPSTVIARVVRLAAASAGTSSRAQVPAEGIDPA